MLELIYSPEKSDNIFLQLFLACFGGYGKPRGWWKFLAGMEESYLLTNGKMMYSYSYLRSLAGVSILEYADSDDAGEHSETDDAGDIESKHSSDAAKANLVYAWALQLLLGLCGINACAVLDGDGIQLEWSDAHISVTTEYISILDMKYDTSLTRTLIVSLIFLFYRKPTLPVKSLGFHRTASMKEVLEATLTFIGYEFCLFILCVFFFMFDNCNETDILLVG